MTKTIRAERDRLVSMRAPRAEWSVIDRAAAAIGKTRTAFVLDAAKRQAEDVLKERTSFTFNAAQWVELTKALDAPVKATERKLVAKLLTEKPAWERGA